MMHPRWTLATLSLFVLLMFGVGSIAQAKTLKIATVAPDGTTWMKQLRAGAAEIRERTNERVRIKYYPGGVMGDTATVLKKMRIGQLHGGAFTGADLARFYPDAQLYSLPLLFRSSDEVDYVRERIDPLLINGLRDKGMVALGISNGGFAYFMATAPLRSISDLKGRKVWAPEGDRLTQSIFAAAGISAVPLSVADVYTGLQTGLIDTIAGIPTGVIAFQWHTSISHLTHVPLMFLSGMLAVDAKVFSRISDADQAITRAVMARIFRDLDEANRKDNLAALEALRKQGITFVEPDDGQLVSWQAMADTALENIQKDGAFSADILEKMMAHLYNYRSQTVSNAQQP